MGEQAEQEAGEASGAERADVRVWRSREGALAPDDLEECLACLWAGRVVVAPTETVYGLAVDALNETALVSLIDLKGRPATKGLPLQVAAPEQVSVLVQGELPLAARRLLDDFAPGPLTVVLQGRPDLPAALLGEGGTVGIRIPDHPVMLQVLRAWGGPLAVTSANRSGEPPAVTAEEAIRMFPEGLGGVVDGGPCRFGLASTVVDLTAEPLRVVREGAITAGEIARVLS